MSRNSALSFFPTRDSDGRALQKEFTPMAKALGFIVSEHQDANIKDYTNACWNEDVVVVDATVTRPGEHNYEIAIRTSVDHVLVVSRRYLPINFYGLRDAVWDIEAGSLIYGAPFYPNTLSNKAILRWLYLQLQEFRNPRPDGKKRIIKSLLSSMSRSSSYCDKQQNRSGQVFISYRTKDWPGVRRLKKKIEEGRFHEGQGKAVRCLPPNALAEEVMTEQRRWQMLCMIDRFIGSVDEFWAFEGKDYYDSWWTLGELAALAYRSDIGCGRNQSPKLRVFNPDDEEPYSPAPDYLPELTSEHRNRLARWFANCDAAEICAESIVVIRLLSELPLIKRLSYFRDRVWENEFWQYPVLDCKKCRQIGKQGNRFDIESFLWTRDPGFFRFSPREIKSCILKRQITCPRCKTGYGFVQGPPQYLWMPLINGKRTGDFWKAILNIDCQDDDFSLIPLPTYRML